MPKTTEEKSDDNGIGWLRRTTCASALTLGLATLNCQPSEEDLKAAMARELGKNPDSEDVVAVVRSGISVEDMRQYKERFNVESLLFLKRENFSFHEAARYPKPITVGWIWKLAKELKVSADAANSYPERFHKSSFENGPSEMFELVRGGVDGKLAAQYPDQLDAQGIVRLKEAGVNPETAKKYPRWFNGYEIARFVNAKISPDVLEKYNVPQGFDGRDIAVLIGAGISDVDAADYAAHFNGPQTQYLVRAKIPLKKALLYLPRFDNGLDVAELWKAGVNPRNASRYPEEFSGSDIAALFRARISPEKAAKLKGDLAHAGDSYVSVHEIIKASEKNKKE